MDFCTKFIKLEVQTELKFPILVPSKEDDHLLKVCYIIDKTNFIQISKKTSYEIACWGYFFLLICACRM